MRALQSYYEVFFAKEEKRIRPKLNIALKSAKASAKKLHVSDLLEQLFQGLRFVELAEIDNLILAPSYWSTPIAIYSDMDSNRRILTFGARPAEDSLVPGEVIPDAVLQALKALSDPTRLRAPTVTNHLHVLRLAGLVNYTLERKNERQYSARLETVSTIFAALNTFLVQTDRDPDVS